MKRVGHSKSATPPELVELCLIASLWSYFFVVLCAVVLYCKSSIHLHVYEFVNFLDFDEIYNTLVVVEI